MQVVTFKTAQRLKEAGFPQPSEILKGNDAKRRWLLFYTSPEYEDEEGINIGPYTADRIEDIRSFGDPCEVVAFAPTATDLIPEGWLLQNRGDDWICSNVFFYDGNDNELIEVVHNNPAEAAAMAWMRVNNKKA